MILAFCKLISASIESIEMFIYLSKRTQNKIINMRKKIIILNKIYKIVSRILVQYLLIVQYLPN